MNCAPKGLPRRRRPHARQRGQILILVALLIPVLMGIIGLAVDSSRAAVTAVQAQSATDAASLAAATAINTGQSTSSESPAFATASAAAQNVAVANGLTSAGAALTVKTTGKVTTAKNSALSLTYTTNADSTVTVQTTVTETQNTYFMRTVGIPSITVSDAAAAKATPPSGGGGMQTPVSGLSAGCGVCVINPGAVSDTMVIKGSPTSVTFSGGNVMDDGTSPTSLDNSSTSTTVTGTNGAQFGVSGGSTGSFSPAPLTGVAAISDPWANISNTPPSASNDPWLTYYGDGSNSGSTDTVLNPGVYSKLTNTGSGGISLNPGIYIVTGAFGGNASVQVCKTCGSGGGTHLFSYSSGGGSFTSSGPYIDGSAGVLIYLACPLSKAPYYTTCAGANKNSMGYVDVEGSNTLVLNPYNCGCSSSSSKYVYNGMSIIYDPSINLQAKIVGNGQDVVSGGIYIPLAQLYLSGSSGSLSLTSAQIVANEIQIDGSADVSISTTNIPGTGSASGGGGGGSGSSIQPSLIT